MYVYNVGKIETPKGILWGKIYQLIIRNYRKSRLWKSDIVKR